MADTIYSMRSAIEQVEACEFECEGGPLSNNVGWRWLKDAAANGPEFWPGQQAWFLIDATAAGKTLTQWVQFTIVGCTMDATDTRRIWTYNLSYDPPAPGHFGTTHFTGVRAEKLRLEKPETVDG